MFDFRAWKPAADIGCVSDVVAAFKERNASFWKDAERTIQPDITFEIVDLRPTKIAPERVASLVKEFTDLLLANANLRGSFRPNSRFLFVGSVRTLATRESESVEVRAIKQDVELFIRTLQNYEIAHYADVGRFDLASDDSRIQIQSALIGLVRLYSEEPSVEPNHLTTTLSDIRDDVNRMIQSARGLPEFEFLGSAEDPKNTSATFRPELLLPEIGALYQFGKGARPEYNPADTLRELQAKGELTFDVRLRESDQEIDEHSSYRLYIAMLSKMGEWAQEFHAEAIGSDEDDHRTARFAIAEEIAKRSFKLARYELLRDFGRVLGQGTLHRLRREGTEKPILLIDDEFHDILTRSDPDDAGSDRDHLVRRLVAVFGIIGRTPKQIHVARSEIIDAHMGLMQANQISKLIEAPGNADGATGKPEFRPVGLDRTPVSLLDRLDGYLAILIDPESRRDPCGPIRVQRLASHLQQRFGPDRTGHRGSQDHHRLPPLLAFSRKESSGYVQQCLNMGATAFVPKSRTYHVLFDLSRGLLDERRRRDPDEQASQFRILKSLKPHVAAKLLRRRGPSYVYGGLELTSERHVADTREERWIRNLPKADLHYHLGTAINYEIIGILALNTAGHFLAGAPEVAGADADESDANPLLVKLARTLALTWQLERSFVPADGITRFSRLELMAAAAHAVQKQRTGRSLRNTPFGLGDAIVQHLLEPNDRCDEAHATALLVAMMSSPPTTASLPRLVTDYFTELKGLADTSPPKSGPGSKTMDFEARTALRIEMLRAHEHFHRVACRWNGSCTRDDYDDLAGAAEDSFWEKLEKRLIDRIGSAGVRLRQALDCQIGWAQADSAASDLAMDWIKEHNPELYGQRAAMPSDGTPDSFDLAAYVSAPDVKQGRGLQLYLRGADLLGSAHLQYPENLWIAALAITEDNARENVIYSEIRCETTGYTAAGMGAQDATELLRHGFNLASLYIAGLPLNPESRHKRPLVRTNLLLAAKRHKDQAKARAVVALLETYLERRAAQADAARSRRQYQQFFGNTIPRWWRPCDVVGFDLSGDESRDEPWLKTVITPLAQRSSPVTIHAGEAASAGSIWRAVYELNALRIGHGLRLSEDIALLSYCVREGICMELCPNSNRYTNQFNPKPRRDVGSPLRYEYPLRHYMRQGMEVSIGTDNRYLHDAQHQTLTSEYMTAARLVSGLTRWEVLQIVKAGFKNAFVDKVEVRAMIEAVEEEIYRIIATNNG